MFFFRKKKYTPPNRNFSTFYFQNEEKQSFFNKNGYVVIENIVNEEEIHDAYSKFQEIKKLEGYNVNERFESSGNFTSVSTQETIFKYIAEYMHKIAPRFANMKNCEIGNGGAFFIKPNSIKSTLEPHQDSTVLDETKEYGVFVWVPLTDIDIKNGPLYLLPGSHLWGNSYRSQHIPWAFRKQCNFLWKYMTPILVKKGDIICFDTAIIHGSGANISNDFRVVLCGALLPSKHTKVEYLLSNKKIYKYYVDDNYWLDGGKESKLKNYPYEVQPYDFPNPISKNEIYQLLNLSGIE